MSSTNKPPATAYLSVMGRLAGCLWLVLAGFGFLFVAGAAGVGIDAIFVLVPLVLIPLVLAIIVFVAGNRVWALLVSAVTGFGYAVLGVWNCFRAEEFERANPGSEEISGGETSLTFVLLMLAISVWSLGAAGVTVRRQRRHRQ